MAPWENPRSSVQTDLRRVVWCSLNGFPVKITNCNLESNVLLAIVVVVLRLQLKTINKKQNKNFATFTFLKATKYRSFKTLNQALCLMNKLRLQESEPECYKVPLTMSSPYKQQFWSAVFVSTRSSSDGDIDLRTWLRIKKGKKKR